jgi:TPR repeat protein
MLTAAARLCSVAKVDLAYYFENGIGCDKDQAGAIKLYNEAAREGCPSAMRILASRFWKGESGVARDLAKAKELYQRAGDLGDGDALAWLVSNNLDKKATTTAAKASETPEADLAAEQRLRYARDPVYRQKSDEMRRKHNDILSSIDKQQMKSDNIAAQSRIETKYDEYVKRLRSELAVENAKPSGEWDGLKAGGILARLTSVQILQNDERIASADANQPTASSSSRVKYSGDELVELGKKYEKGDGVPEDINKANQLYQKAGDLGEGRGYYNLGVNYTTGAGVTRDFKIAAQLFEKAGDLGCGAGYSNLGMCYENGMIGPSNPSKAFEFYEKAAALKCGMGFNNMGVVMQGRFEYTRANELFMRAGELGEGLGYHNLAQNYRTGRGVSPNSLKARELEDKATALGYNPTGQSGSGMTDAEALQKIKDDPGALARSFFLGLIKELTTHNPEREPSPEEPLGFFDNPWHDGGDGTMYRYDPFSGVTIVKRK